MTFARALEVSFQELSYRQRWNHYLVLIMSGILLFAGVSLRDNALMATTLYTNTGAGIQAQYPRNWLLDSSGDYIFRVRDISHPGFKTTIQVSVQAVGTVTTVRNVLDSLTLNRAQVFAAYKVLSLEDNYVLPDESRATIVNYTYAIVDPDPFLQSIPSVVRGYDIITIKRGQAIIITFLSDSNTFETNFEVFERFVNSLEF